MKKLSGGFPFRLKPALALKLPALAGCHHLCRINGFTVDLHFHDFSFFVDQEVDPAADLGFVVVETVFSGYLAAPIAQQREGDVDFFRPSGVAEGAVHAYTQYLGICSFQFLQVRLEVLHLLGSTTGEGEDIKRQRDVLLPLEVM